MKSLTGPPNVSRFTGYVAETLKTGSSAKREAEEVLRPPAPVVPQVAPQIATPAPNPMAAVMGMMPMAGDLAGSPAGMAQLAPLADMTPMGGPMVPQDPVPFAVPVPVDPRDEILGRLGQEAERYAPDYSRQSELLGRASELAANPVPLPERPNAEMSDAQAIATIFGGLFGQGAQVGTAAWMDAFRQAEIGYRDLMARYEAEENGRRTEIGALGNEARYAGDQAEEVARIGNDALDDRRRGDIATLGSLDREAAMEATNARNAAGIESREGMQAAKLTSQEAQTAYRGLTKGVADRGGPKTQSDLDYIDDALADLETRSGKQYGFYPRPLLGATVAQQRVNNQNTQAGENLKLAWSKLRQQDKQWLASLEEKIRNSKATLKERTEYHREMLKLGGGRLDLGWAGQRLREESGTRAADQRDVALDQGQQRIDKPPAATPGKEPSRKRYDSAQATIDKGLQQERYITAQIKETEKNGGDAAALKAKLAGVRAGIEEQKRIRADAKRDIEAERAAVPKAGSGAPVPAGTIKQIAAQTRSAKGPSCANFACQIGTRVYKGFPKTDGAGDLVEKLKAKGAVDVSRDQAREGDVVYYYGRQYGKKKDAAGNGWHVGWVVGNGPNAEVRDSSGNVDNRQKSLRGDSKVLRLPDSMRKTGPVAAAKTGDTKRVATRTATKTTTPKTVRTGVVGGSTFTYKAK